MLDAKEGTRGSELSFSSSFTFHLYLLPVPFLHARSCCKNGIALRLPQDSAIPFFAFEDRECMNCAFILSKHFLIVKLPPGMFFEK